MTRLRRKEAAYNNNENANKQADTDVPVVAPVEQKSVDQTAVVDNNDNVPVRHENVSYESGEPLKAYSVVIGSFSIKANADDLLSRLQHAGYKASVVSADINGTPFYRVLSATADTKSEAVSSRNAIKGSMYNPKGDAWIPAK